MPLVLGKVLLSVGLGRECEGFEAGFCRGMPKQDSIQTRTCGNGAGRETFARAEKAYKPSERALLERLKSVTFRR